MVGVLTLGQATLLSIYFASVLGKMRISNEVTAQVPISSTTNDFILTGLKDHANY